MNIINDIKPVTYLKSRAADLLNQINKTHRPVIITQNGEPRAVLQDPESYENMRNAIGLLKLISQGESDVRNGRVKPQEEVFKDIENSGHGCQTYTVDRYVSMIKQAAKVLGENVAILKRVQIYLHRRFSGQKLKDIGIHFGIGVSGVSQASRRVALQIKDERKLKKRLIKLF